MSEVATPLEGKLGKSTLAALLARLLDEGRDGCLTCTRGAVTRRLFLRDGMIVSGGSTDPQDRLGEILIAQGKLTRADHRKYWELAKAEGRRLGQTLVVNDRITTTDFYQGVTAQVVTILDRLQKWQSGDYRFEEGCEPEAGSLQLRIPLALYLRAEGRPKAAAKEKPGKEPKTEPAPKAPRVAGKTAKGGGRRKKTAPGPAAAPAPGPTAPAAAAPSAPGAPPPGAEEPEIAIEEEAAPCPTPEQAEEDRIGEICFLVQELKGRAGQDPRSLLGVDPGADREAIREAYLRMARLLHADTLPKELPAGVAAGAEEVIRLVTAAFHDLDQEAARRGKAPLATGASHPGFRDPEAEAIEQARAAFQQGREYISRGNYWQATQSMREAVRLRPKDAAFRQFLGLSLLQVKRLHEAEEQLREATRLEPRNPQHFVNLGRVYRTGHLYRKAREAFERALKLDPRNEHAREELSDLPEEQEGGRRSGGSILKKLFGK